MVVDEELCDAVLKIIQPLSQQDLHKEITEQVCRLIDGKHASIFGYEKDALKRLHTTTPMLHAVIPRKNGLTACTFRKRKAYIRTMVDGKRTYPMFGKLRVGSGIFFPIHDNKKTLTVISVFSKIDDRKVKEKVKRLERLRPFLVAALKNVQEKESIKNDLQQRDLFIALAAHELKTPLTSISLYVQMLAKKKSKTSRRKEIQERLLQSVNRMNLLANEFLQINNLQLGTLQFLFKEKSLKGVLQKTLSQFQDIYATHRLNFLNMTKRGEDIAILDEEKLRLVLGNLINNAVKYSEEGSEIEVSLSRKERWAVISVTDHGSGIAPEDLEKIFDKFYQGNASYKQGLGLGLYLVKQVVARHNGFMKAHSALGKGTTMSMYLPVVRV